MAKSRLERVRALHEQRRADGLCRDCGGQIEDWLTVRGARLATSAGGSGAGVARIETDTRSGPTLTCLPDCAMLNFLQCGVYRQECNETR